MLPSVNATPSQLADKPIIVPKALVMKHGNDLLFGHITRTLNLQNLLFLDFEGSSNITIITNSSAIFVSLNISQLLYLNLNACALTKIPAYTFMMPDLLHLYVVNTSLLYIEENAFNNLFSLVYLDLSGNQLIIIEDFFFFGLSKLSILLLHGNPISDIHSETFINLPDLSIVRADWYMVCCVVPSAVDCLPEVSKFLSSCTDLIQLSTTGSCCGSRLHLSYFSMLSLLL
jgi:hypothetical protein